MTHNNFNRSWFKELNTPEKVYFAFFILGDGHLTKEGYRIQINLDDEDEYILKRLIDEIDGNYSFLRHNQTHSNIVHLDLNSKEMVKDLENYGMIKGCKKYTAKWLKIDKQFEFHAIRGILDSDGNIQERRKEKRPSFLFRVIGTENICINVSKILGYNGNYVYKKEPNSKGGFTYIFVKSYSHYKDMKELYDKLYPNKMIPCLVRKQKRIEDIMNKAKYFEEKEDNKLKNIIDNLIGKGLNYQEIGKLLDLGTTTICKKHLSQRIK